MTKSYEAKAVPTKIQATSRISLKVSETFYTVEYTEERAVPDIEGVDIVEERRLLWDTVNAEVDKQAEDIQLMYAKRK